MAWKSFIQENFWFFMFIDKKHVFWLFIRIFLLVFFINIDGKPDCSFHVSVFKVENRRKRKILLLGREWMIYSSIRLKRI